MTTEPNRVDAGVPTGGQFAAKIQSDDVVSLGAPTRRPELAGWPESLPEPEIDVQVGEGGTISTLVKVNGEDVFDIWNPADDIHDTESDDFVTDAIPEDVYEDAKAWAFTKHNEMADAIREELRAAFERTRAGILAKATGVPAPQTDEELEKIVDESFTAASFASREGELASTALIARGVLKEHPDAHAIGLVISTADDDDYVSGAVVYNENREQIGYYDEDDTYNTEEDRPDRPFLQHLKSLRPSSADAWWTKFNVRPVRDREDLYTIELTRAAAWSPGSNA